MKPIRTWRFESPIEPRSQQFPDDPVLVGKWPLDEDAPIHPGGMKPKRVFICPEDVRQPYLIRGHRYLFKEGEGFRAQQLWSEVIAYELSRATGTPVPPAFVAYDETRGRSGVLIEFFFNHPGGYPPHRFVHAIELMQRTGMRVDLRRGSLRENLALCRLYSVPHRIAWWADALAFDSLIGNTDRHTENWGFLRQTAEPADPEYTLAPVFDNGTSLGFQIRDADLAKFSQPDAIQRLVAGGSHHYGWLAGDSTPIPHAALCARLMQTHALARAAMEGVLELRDSHINDTLQWCTRFSLDVPFSAERAEFVRRLLRARLQALAAATGS
jgi:hypothetical protein